MHQKNIRETVALLRKTGFSYTYISSKTGISKSTLSGWLAEIPYRPNKEMLATLGNARAAAGARRAELRQQETRQIRALAVKDVGHMSKRDLFMFGLGLYLGEGSKTNSQIRVINANPRVIRASIVWFQSLGVKKAQFRVRLYLYPDSDVKRCLQFWSKTTSIPVSQFQKHQVDARTNKKAGKRNTLPFGTAQLTVQSAGREEYGVRFFRKIQLWNEAVLGKTDEAGIV